MELDYLGQVWCAPDSQHLIDSTYKNKDTCDIFKALFKGLFMSKSQS